jgi:hypothetical protein
MPSNKPRLLTVNGETHCLSEWARRLGVNPATIRTRLEYDWTAEDAVTLLPKAREDQESAKLTYQGETLRLTEWARRTGQSASRLRSRVYKQRLPLEVALAKPNLKTGRKKKQTSKS